MPRIKRWFPVTHEINSDPEVWELRDRFGDRAGFVWLEMLSIADRYEGKVGPNSGSIRAALAAKCRTSRAKVESVFGFAADKGWIKLDTNVRVLKFADYHRTRGTNEIPTGKPNAPPLPNPPNLPNLKDEVAETDRVRSDKRAVPAPATPAPFQKKENAWKEIASRIYRSDQKRFRNLMAWINKAMGDGRTGETIAATLVRFESLEQRNGPVIKDWWPYLTDLLSKEHALECEQRLEQESNKYKAEAGGGAEEWLRPLIKKFSPS